MLQLLRRGRILRSSNREHWTVQNSTSAKDVVALRAIFISNPLTVCMLPRNFHPEMRKETASRCCWPIEPADHWCPYPSVKLQPGFAWCSFKMFQGIPHETNLDIANTKFCGGCDAEDIGGPIAVDMALVAAACFQGGKCPWGGKGMATRILAVQQERWRLGQWRTWCACRTASCDGGAADFSICGATVTRGGPRQKIPLFSCTESAGVAICSVTKKNLSKKCYFAACWKHIASSHFRSDPETSRNSSSRNSSSSALS